MYRILFINPPPRLSILNLILYVTFNVLNVLFLIIISPLYLKKCQSLLLIRESSPSRALIKPSALLESIPACCPLPGLLHRPGLADGMPRHTRTAA